MAIGFGKSGDDVVSLIAAKKYARAIEVLKAQLQKKGANPSLRMQLADVLILADKKQEAVALLIPLADQFAREGFAAKAVSVLKKIQKVDPGRRDVEERLARQIEEKQREAVSLPLARPGAGAGASDVADGGPVIEIGFEMAPISAPVPEAPPEPQALELPKAVAEYPPDATVPAQAGRGELPAAFADAPVSETLDLEPLEPQGIPSEPALVSPKSSAPPLATAAPGPSAHDEAEVEDYDLLYIVEAGEADEEIDVPLDGEILEAEAQPAAEPMSANQFADELMGLVDS